MSILTSYARRQTAPRPSSHPLNRGRVAWWMGVPGRMGGNTLVDLMGKYPAAVQGTAKWSKARPFAAPALDGSTVYRADATNLGDTAQGPATWGVRFTPDAAFVSGIGSYPILFARWTDTYTDYIWSQSLVAQPDGTVHTDSPGSYNYHASWTPTAGVEAMLAWTWNGSRNGFKFYIDGVSQSVSEDAWASVSTSTSGAPFQVGGHPTTRQSSGLMSEAFYFDRALSDAEMAQLHAESRLGYPNLLERTRPYFPTYSTPSSGGGWLNIGYLEEDPMSITYGSWTTDLSAVTVTPGTAQDGSALSLDGKAAALLSLTYAKAEDDGISSGTVVLEYLKDRDGTNFETRPGVPSKQSHFYNLPAYGQTGAITLTVYASEGKAIKPRIRATGCPAVVTLRTMTGTA